MSGQNNEHFDNDWAVGQKVETPFGIGTVWQVHVDLFRQRQGHSSAFASTLTVSCLVASLDQLPMSSDAQAQWIFGQAEGFVDSCYQGWELKGVNVPGFEC